jgi:outer membrane biosynthesis protein TonB
MRFHLSMDQTRLLMPLVAVMLVAGCMPVQQAPMPPAAAAEPLPARDSLPVAEAPVVAEVPVVNEVTPSQPEALKPEAAQKPLVSKPMPAPKTAVPVPVSPSTPAVAAKTTTPAAKATAPAANPVQPPRLPSVAATPAPPLDLAGLESRLRETKAIGVMTKLALKNQVDDLLDRFRSHYRGGHKAPLPELRAAYDRLLMKLLSLLQDGDPALAKKIVSSREAIWGILSDPKKFSDNKLMAGA